MAKSNIKKVLCFGDYVGVAKLSVSVDKTTTADVSRSLCSGQVHQALHHWGRAGDALDDGACWRATNGIEDVQRVRQNTLHAVFDGIDLK